MKLSARIKYLPSAIIRGLAMGVRKRGIVKGCTRFLFRGSFRKPNKFFKNPVFTWDNCTAKDKENLGQWWLETLKWRYQGQDK